MIIKETMIVTFAPDAPLFHTISRSPGRRFFLTRIWKLVRWGGQRQTSALVGMNQRLRLMRRHATITPEAVMIKTLDIRSVT